MSEIIDHLEKFRDNLAKLSGKIESESGYSTKLFASQTQDESRLTRTEQFSKTQPHVELFQNEVKTLVDENNSLRNELKKIISEQIEEDLHENNSDQSVQKERIELAQKKREMAEEMCGAAMERVDQLERELESVRDMCDVPAVYAQLQKVQLEYRRVFAVQSDAVEELQNELRRAKRSNRMSEVQIADYRTALEDVRARVKARSSKMEDLCELRMIYDGKMAELEQRAESDAHRIQEMDIHVAMVEAESRCSRERLAVLQQEIKSLEEAKERAAREHKEHNELAENFEATKIKIRRDLAQKEAELESYRKHVADIIAEAKFNAQEQVKIGREKQEQATQNTRNDNLRLNQENADLRNKLLAERDHHAKMQAESEKARRKLAGQIQEIYDSKNRQNKKMQSLISERQSLLREREQMKEKLTKMLTKGNDESTRLQREAETLANRIKFLEAENVQTQKNCENSIDQKNSLLEEVRDELITKNKQCICLKSKLNSLVDELKEARVESEKHLSQQVMETEAMREEMNALLKEQQSIGEKWKSEYKDAVSQRDREMESLVETNRKLEKGSIPLKKAVQKYEWELEDRDELIERHQAQYLDAQRQIAKCRQIINELTRNVDPQPNIYNSNRWDIS